MKKILFIILLTIPFIVFGQGWEQTYGYGSSEAGHSVKQTNDGGYIITGFTMSIGNGSQDVWLIKTDSNGNELWSQTYGTFGEEYGHSVQQTNDGGYIITGKYNSGGFGDFGLIKTDQLGNELWTKTYGPGEGHSVEQTNDGGYIISGLGGAGFCLIKTDINGDSIWSKTIPNPMNSYNISYSVKQTNDGGYISTGRFNDNLLLIKIDGNGNELWSQNYGGNLWDEGRSVHQTSDGGYIITGGTSTFSNNGLGLKDPWLIKTDSFGNELWSQVFSSSIGGLTGTGYSVQPTIDGGYILCSNQSSDPLIKTNVSGTIDWTLTTLDLLNIDPNSSYLFHEVIQTSDGGFVVTGSKGFPYSDTFLIKLDSQGNITSTFEIPLPKPDRKLEKTVNIIGQEVKPQTNQPVIEIFDDGSTQKKLIIEK